MPGTVGQEASVEGLPHAFGGREMTAGPGIAVMRTGVHRQGREQAEQKKRSQAQAALAR
jgi:hypothetical protein